MSLISAFKDAGGRFTCRVFWLDVAESIDALRIFPRSIVAAFGYLLGHVVLSLLHWYFALSPADRTAQVTAVIGIVIPSVSGLAVWVYKIYAEGGRDWVSSPPGTDILPSSK